MNLLIRPATLNDLEALVHLNGVVQELHVRQRPDQYQPLTGRAIETWFRETLAKPQCVTWLGLSAGRAVGYVLTLVYTRGATPFSPARSWLEFDQVAVDPSVQNQGFGTALLSHALDAARATGHTQVELTTWGFNHAGQALFRKAGFTTKNLRLELALPAEPIVAKD
jgi:GNAT superfamily N-acetyltransferase